MIELKKLDKIIQPYKDRIQKYAESLYNHFDEDLIGMLVFGSVARGEEKIIKKYESDVDILAIIDNLGPAFSIERLNQRLKVQSVYSVESTWVTKWDLEQYFAAKTGFILDAFYEGIIVYDPQSYLSEKRDELFKELKEKGVVRKPRLGWVFPIKIGEKIEY